MGILRFRDENGVEHNVVALKGEAGGYAPHTHPLSEITHTGYDSVQTLIENVQDQAELAERKAYQASNDVMTLGSQLAELNAGFVRLEEETIPNVSSVANAAQQYATEAQETASTAQNEALTAHQKADDALEQLGDIKSAVETLATNNDAQDGILFDVSDRVAALEKQNGNIETALDTIIAIQNELIGGDGV
jgi:methyl-accepting chemotaxis protein